METAGEKSTQLGLITEDETRGAKLKSKAQETQTVKVKQEVQQLNEEPET